MASGAVSMFFFLYYAKSPHFTDVCRRPAYRYTSEISKRELFGLWYDRLGCVCSFESHATTCFKACIAGVVREQI